MIWARQPKMAVIWAVLALACYLPGAAADFFRIAIQADITDASWGQTDLRAVPANIPIPVGTEAPPDFLKIYHYNGPSDSPGNAGYGSGMSFKFKNGVNMASPTAIPSQYRYFNMWIYPISGRISEFQFKLTDKSDKSIVDTRLYNLTGKWEFEAGTNNLITNPYEPAYLGDTGTDADFAGLTPNQWTKLRVDMDAALKRNALKLAANQPGAKDDVTIFFFMPAVGGQGTVEFYVALWLGDLPTTYTVPSPPVYNDPPFVGPKGETSYAAFDQSKYTFLTDHQNSDQNNQGEKGIVPMWDCDGAIWRGYGTLHDFPLRAFRDTTAGPVAMNLLANADYNYEDGVINYLNMYGGKYVARDAFQIPNPILGCVLHNADYFEIGDVANAEKVLNVWAPLYVANAHSLIGGYALWAKAKKDAGEKVAVVFRSRIPNSMLPRQISRDFEASPFLKVNCTQGAPGWQCPDHWWFSDTQLGVMKQQKDNLLPLTNFTRSYFRETGYDPTVDMLGQALTLVTYDGEPYALPAWVNGYPWLVRNRLFVDHQERINGLDVNVPKLPFKAPPPVGDWGSAWWLDWNMTTFNKMLDYMYTERGLRNIFTIPPDMSETAFYSYIFNHYGATIFDAQGHCGLDDKALEALKKTYVHWTKNEVDGSNRTSFLSWRPAEVEGDALTKWVNEPINWERPQDDALKMPIWWHPVWRYSWEATGFDTSSCYQTDCVSIYPPTGLSMITAGLVGMPKTSREANRKLAFDALMNGIVRNPTVQANVPQDQKFTGGISPWLSAQNLAEYKKANKAWWQNLIGHGVFAGYPAPQTYGYYEADYYDPIKLVTSEMMYKNITAEQAIERACKLINYATRRPCTSDDWQVDIITDPKKNRDTVNYTWPEGINEICRTDFAVTKQPLPAIKNYLISTQISTNSMTGQALMGIQVLGILIEVLLMILFVIKREHPVIKAASFFPSLMIMFGAILALISVMMRVSSNKIPPWTQCFGTYWFFSIGFSMVLGSLAMKTYRVDKIFRSSTKGKSAPMSNFALISAILGLCLGNVILMLIYQFAIKDNSRVKKTDLPNTDIVLEQADCPIPYDFAPVLLYVYNGLIIVLAAFYSYRTRNIISSFNENTFTIASISLISVISIIIVPVLQMINSAEASFLLIALGTFLASVLSTLVFAVPKLLMAFGITRSEDVRSTFGKTIGNPTMPTRGVVGSMHDSDSDNNSSRSPGTQLESGTGTSQRSKRVL